MPRAHEVHERAKELLTPSQHEAIAFVERHARAQKDAASAQVEHICEMSNVAPDSWADAVAQIRAHAAVALHFHPDRIGSDGRTVVQCLLADGEYKNQFATGLSNGMLSPERGGARDRWENAMFGGAFGSDVALSERPKYGAFDLMQHADGPSPRFGSCYLVLTPAASRRSTFVFGDSHRMPLPRGSLAMLDEVLAAALCECFERQSLLGNKQIDVTAWVHHLRTSLRRPFDPAQRPMARSLDHYIEAQVHGDVIIARDGARLVADPSYLETQTGDMLQQLCARHGVSLKWHAGFCMHADDVPANFRGPAMMSLARRVAIGGLIDAHAIGKAAASVRNGCATWRDRGSRDAVLQELKRLWHVLVHHGKPRSAVS